MSWSTRFRIEQFLKGSLWVVPLLGGILGSVAGSVMSYLDTSVDLPASWQYSAATASTVLTTIVGASAALTGFVVTVSVLVVQMATGTFSARYMRLWYRDRLLKAVLAALVATLTFSFALLRHVEADSVPNLGVTAAGVLLVLGLILFLFFLDRVLHRLRPVAVAALVADLGKRQLAATAASVAPHPPDEPIHVVDEGEPALVVRALVPGAIQAIDAPGLVRWAERNDCVLVFPHALGDFVPAGAAVVRVHGPSALPGGAADDLRGMVAHGIERTIEQDPAFAIRILVDIANKALSPAVNDPTTAVQSLNHLEDLLHHVAAADLARLGDVRDGHGRVRLVLRTRRWEDYLALATTEIRLYGATTIQVVRQLRSLLDNLLETVRPDYRPAVEAELGRLDATVVASFGDSVDLDRALTADRQGIGGPSAAPAQVAAARAYGESPVPDDASLTSGAGS